MSTFDVIGFGAMNIDRLYQVEHLVRDGETLAEEIGLFPGGSAANTIYALARLGLKTAFWGAVGDDAEGKIIIQSLAQAGVDTSLIMQVKDVKTGSVLALSHPRGRALYVSPGANAYLSRSDSYTLHSHQAQIVHLSSFVHKDQQELQLRLIRELPSQIKVSLAPGEIYASQGLGFLTRFLERTHILFLNRQELRMLSRQDLKTGCQHCLERGCATVVVTLGRGIQARGEPKAIAYVASSSQHYWIRVPSISEKAKETTGAGDAFAAGFLYGFVKDKDPEDCGFLGHLLASYAINEIGARAGLPTLEQATSRFYELYGHSL
ncbi:MAG: carbohydrate kinase family protein [Chloroflexi bacterium]|nr:carbohydrate kinase family protein [Chloroflexota bacterium]